MERSDSRDDALSQLLGILRSAQSREAEYIVMQEISAPGKGAVLPLIEAVQNKEISLKAAAEILGMIGDRGAVEFLCQALTSADPFVVQEAAKALGQIKDPSAIKPLLNVFRTTGAWGDDVDDDTVMAGQSAEDALAAIGGEAVFAALIDGLADDDRNVCISSINTLSYLNDARAIPNLLKMLSYYDWATRRAAVEALGKVGNSQLIPVLLPLLEDENEEYLVRCSVIAVMGKFGAPEAVDPLIRAIADPVPEVRRSAVLNLARLAGYHARLNESESAVKQESIARVKTLYGKEIMRLLKNALADSEEHVRTAAARCLKEMVAETQQPDQSYKTNQSYKIGKIPLN